MLPVTDSSQSQRYKKVESQRMKKTFHANSNQKSTGLAILIPDKIHFESKIVTGDKEDHYILIKGSIHKEDMTILNIYATNNSFSHI